MAAESLPAPVRRARHRCAPGYPSIRPCTCRSPGASIRAPAREVIGPQTELVIDGYTRSASTFAVYAFQLCQDEPVRLAHHRHAPAQLIAAARRSIPALLLIREPQGAILSQLIQEPGGASSAMPWSPTSVSTPACAPMPEVLP